ncbi:MAG: acyltransferase family protein [Gemmataceae bacterium]
MSAAQVDRFHALDSLRAFAMFLGIVLHVALSFMSTVPPFWPVRDTEESGLMDLFVIAVHDFRMQLFFLLSGFFSCLLFQRYGLKGMTIHRLKRVAVPFVLSLVFIAPTVLVVFLYCEVENVRSPVVRGTPSPVRELAAELVNANPAASSERITADFVGKGGWIFGLPQFHLWFLYYLLIFMAAVALLTPVGWKLAGTRLLAAADGAFDRLARSRLRVLAFSLYTFPLMTQMGWIVDTPQSWFPPWHLPAYYFSFFAFGWMLFRHRELVTAFGRDWGLHLILANVTVFPAIFLLMAAESKISVHGASVLYTWMMITGLWGAFLKLFARPSARMRWLADSAYWCYLASLTPILVLQFVVKDWPLPAVVKCALVTAATMALLLASYAWLVRYTSIGAILNGRKDRVAVAA